MVLGVKHRPPKFANNCILINGLTKGFPEPWNEIPFTLLVSQCQAWQYDKEREQVLVFPMSSLTLRREQVSANTLFTHFKKYSRKYWGRKHNAHSSWSVCFVCVFFGNFFVFVLMDVSTGLWSCQQLWFLIVPLHLACSYSCMSKRISVWRLQG
jgi:hypothetical protein